MLPFIFLSFYWQFQGNGLRKFNKTIATVSDFMEVHVKTQSQRSQDVALHV